MRAALSIPSSKPVCCSRTILQGLGPVVEVAHEALFREWPLLEAWIESRREDFHLRERVKTEAAAWSREPGAAKSWQRPWSGHRIDEYRARLERAGFLPELLKNEWVARLLSPEAKWIQNEIDDPGTIPLRRSDLGRRWAEIGDPRPGVGITEEGLPDIIWADIPGGAVTLEVHGVFTVAPFRIARYTVTFAQFRAFLIAKDGYDDRRWWKGLKHDARDEGWDGGLANHPVTNVNWYDATVFCRWLSKRWGMEIRLPHETEWQWAAQSAGGDFAYAWGPNWKDRVANTKESGIGHITAVGVFPEGNSLQGVSDLAGNVWEWCRNMYKDSEREEPGRIAEGESRVLRGGAWSFDLDYARADYRLINFPNNRNLNFGFRVVSSSPIVR
jgi:hypothetical protein